jgi:hypothetical protein
LKDIGIAAALGLQFQSGCNILQFYSRREQLADARKPAERRAILLKMKGIVRSEIRTSAALLPLAEADSRLGFHSEAEGYKYFPALIRWRIRQLQRLLKCEFPSVERRAKRRGSLFPEYTGEKPVGPTYKCRLVSGTPPSDGGVWDGLPQAECAHWLRKTFDRERWLKCPYDGYASNPVPEADRDGRATFWKCCRTADALYFRILCEPGTVRSAAGEAFGGNEVQVLVEPERTLPRIIFRLTSDGSVACVRDDGYARRDDKPWNGSSRLDESGWTMMLEMPFNRLGIRGGGKRRPIRVNVVRITPPKEDGGTVSCSWVERKPIKGQLAWGDLNPAADFGWLLFE